ncbi:MAG: LURP-one-related family protein [Candidatus Bathyarchaeota archaeon]
MIRPENLSLVNPEVDYYVLKEKWWDWGGGDVYDKKGTTMGHMYRRIISLRAFTEVTNNDGSLLFSVERKLISMRPSYMIKDCQENVLGRTNRKILTLFRPQLWLEDEKGTKSLEAQGNFLGKKFEIKDSANRLIAQVGKSDFVRDLILGGSFFDFADTYAVKILDKEYDKRLILGFVIAIDNSVHDKKR